MLSPVAFLLEPDRSEVTPCWRAGVARKQVNVLINPIDELRRLLRKAQARHAENLAR